MRYIKRVAEGIIHVRVCHTKWHSKEYRAVEGNIFLYVILFAFMYVCCIKSMTYLCSALGVSVS